MADTRNFFERTRSVNQKLGRGDLDNDAWVESLNLCSPAYRIAVLDEIDGEAKNDAIEASEDAMREAADRADLIQRMTERHHLLLKAGR